MKEQAEEFYMLIKYKSQRETQTAGVLHARTSPGTGGTFRWLSATEAGLRLASSPVGVSTAWRGPQSPG